MDLQILKNRGKSLSYILTLCLLSLISKVTYADISYSDTIKVSSLTELLPYLDDDSIYVKLAPDTYTITAEDITNGTFTDYTIINDNKAYVLFLFEGNYSTYDFTGVTINVMTEVFNAINSDAGDFFEIQVIGNNNVLKNLTLVDVGSVDDYPKYGCVNVVMDGRENRIEGFHMTTTGSFPYGYGDCFGKGGTYTIKHYKHSAFLIRGNYNHALNDTIYHYSYGHCMFMQAASHPTIEGCYLVGEVRSTDDMLAEEGTGSPADLIDFYTVWGYRLPPGYMKSLGEAGIRAYNAGNTKVDGVDYSRGTDNPTILNCYIKNLRVGVTLTHATGTKYVEGVTAIGTERGFAIGSGDIVDCYSDCQYGPAFGVDYESDKNINAEITILPYEGETYNGSKYAAYLRGTGHNLTFKSAVSNPDQDLKIEFGGDARTIGELGETQSYLAEDITLNNYTNYPIVLNEEASDNSGVSGGMVTDFGTNNNFTHVAVSAGLYQAEDFNNASEVTIETTSDDDGGENVTSINENDYMEYEIDVPYSGTYSIDYRVASLAVDGDFTVSIGTEVLENVTFAATGGDQIWTTITSSSPVLLDKGTQTLKITANSAGWNFNWFDLTLECAQVEIEPYIEVYNVIGETVKTEDALYEVTLFPGNSVSLQPLPSVGGTWSWSGPNGFSANTRVINLDAVGEDDEGAYIATITNDCGEQSSATFTVTVTDSESVEAEDYSDAGDVATETTGDDDAGENVTSIDAGDWMEYTIDVSVSATYTINYRVAGNSDNNSFIVSLDGDSIDQVTFSSTGGDQIWTTISSSAAFYFTEGEHTLKITANSAGWKLNWLELVGQDYVSPCKLPLETDEFDVKNETVNWTTGLMDITCVSSVNVYVELSETGSLSSSDSLNIYYKLDGGEPVEISKNKGSLGEMVNIVRGLTGTTLEVFVEGASSSTEDYYTVTKISVVESTDPFAQIEAEDYDDMEGVNNSGTRLGSIQPGDWSMYSGLDLTGVTSVYASVGTVYSDAYIEVRLDSVTGTLIGTIEVPYTGSYNTYTTASSYIYGVTGIYDVYLVYQTESSVNVCNIDWFQFSDDFIKFPTDPYVRFEAEINDGEDGVASLTTTDVDGDEEVSEIEDGDYVMFSDLDLEAADSVYARVASALDGGIIEVRLGSVTGDIISYIDVPYTGSSSSWQTVSAPVDGVEGVYDIYFVFRGDDSDLFRLNWLLFTTYESPFVKLEAEDYDDSSDTFMVGDTSDDEDDDVDGEVLKYLPADSWVKFADVDLTGAASVNARFGTVFDDAYIEVRLGSSTGELIGTINLYDTDGWNEWETASANITSKTGTYDVYFVYKTESSSVVCYSNWFQFSSLSVEETIDPMARIEAEAYDRASGTVTSITTDVDGEEELGAIEYGDWILFNNIDLTGVKSVDVRVSSIYSNSRIELRTGSYSGPLLTSILIPNTGSSSVWETVSADFSYEVEGEYDVYLIFKGSTTSDDLLNINWLQFKSTSTDILQNNYSSEIFIYPNPIDTYVKIKNAMGASVKIFNIGGAIVGSGLIDANEFTLETNMLPDGVYLIEIVDKDGDLKSFKVVK